MFKATRCSLVICHFHLNVKEIYAKKFETNTLISTLYDRKRTESHYFIQD